MKTEFSRHELYAMGMPFGDGSTRKKPGGRGIICGGGGGGGGQVKYENLERLYAMQAEQGQQLMDMAKKNVYPAYEQLMDDAKGAGSLANQDKAANNAAADVAAASGAAKTRLTDNLVSMGVNPDDPRYANTMAKMETDSAAQSAAAQTGARDRTQQLGFAKLQDVTSMGMGIGSQATAALNAAGGSAAGAAQMQLNQMSQDQTARGNIAALGARMAFKDGGEVKAPSRLKCGGMVKGYALGGFVGGAGSVTPPPPSGAPGRSVGMRAVDGAATATQLGGGKMLAKGIEKVGEMTGNNAMQSFGTGMRLGDKAQPAIDAYKGAAEAAKATADTASSAVANAGNAAQYANELDAAASAAPTTAGAVAPGAADMTAAATAADTAQTAAAAAGGVETAAAGAGAAETLGATSAALGAGSAVAAALPWVGGALLIGGALGLFKDGGAVNKKRLAVADGTRGGHVSGPGGPKDDAVPAMLSDGEFVMPVGAVKLFGKDKLEQMRQQGLAYEKQAGIGG